MPVANRSHVVVRAADFHGLLLNERLRRRRKVLLERVLIHALGDVLAALGFGDDRMVVMARQDGLEIEPAPMQRTAHAPALVGITAEATHLGLELSRHTAALARIFEELGFDRRALQSFCCRLETLLAVLARFDQVVEYGHCVSIRHLEFLLRII